MLNGISFSVAQNTKSDSLLSIINNSKSADTSIVKAYNALAESYGYSNIDTVIPISLKAVEVVEKSMMSSANSLKTNYVLLFNKTMALNNIAYVYSIGRDDHKNALYYYERAKAIATPIDDKYSLANYYLSVGYIYKKQGDLQKALQYYNKSVTLHEEIKDDQGLSYTLNNLAYIYKEQNENAKALEFFQKALDIQLKTEDKVGQATAMNNIGLIYDEEKNYERALSYYAKALDLYTQESDKEGVAVVYHNTGTVYKLMGQAEKAVEYISKGLALREEIADKYGIANSLITLGKIYNEQQNSVKAKELCLRSLSISKEIGYPESIRGAAELLANISKKEKKFEEALNYFELFTLMKDSISNANTKEETIRSQFRYEYDKKAVADNVRAQEEKKVTQAQLNQEKTQRYALYGGMGLTILFGSFMFNRYRVTRRQKNIIEEQKKIVTLQKYIVEEKQKEILDSIHYAKRIQRSLLPTEKYIQKKIKELKGE